MGVAVFVAPGTGVCARVGVAPGVGDAAGASVLVALTVAVTPGDVVNTGVVLVGGALVASPIKTGVGATVPTSVPSTWLATTSVGVGNSTGFVAVGRGVSVGSGVFWHAAKPARIAAAIILPCMRFNMFMTRQTCAGQTCHSRSSAQVRQHRV